jgi:hypothetical protein
VSFKTTISRLLVRTFSLGNEGATPAERASRFIIQLAAWMLVARIVLAIWAIVYPDSRFFSSIDAISIASKIEFLGDTIPANDSFFYWLIAQNGAGWNPEYEWALVNFSQVFPAILAVVKPVFSTWSPYIVNTAFAIATPWFLVGFLNRVIKNETAARRVAIAILFNPIFLAYSILGLTEPLHYLLLFAALSAHYKTGIAWRLVEYASLVLLVLNRFIAVILAVFYVYKALFTRGTALKQRILLFVPVAIMGATYIGWEWICKMVFGHTPSEARSFFWHHEFNLNPLAPDFMVNQAPLLLAGAVLGLLVLISAFSKVEESRNLEASEFTRTDTQALIAVGAMTFILLGLLNVPVSVLRYTGTAFPLFMVILLRVPTSKRLPLVSFGVATGMVVSHQITIFALFFTNLSTPTPSFTSLDLVLCTAFTISFIGASIALYLKRYAVKSDNTFMLAHLLLALLVVPLSLYFP